jgi:conjugal transfer pilus assembly protein TraL
MKPVKIPQRVDEPPHLALWSADELIPMLLGLVVGVLIGKALICTGIGFTLTYWYRRYREAHPDGYFVHRMYWAGLPVTVSKTFINPFIKRVLP